MNHALLEAAETDLSPVARASARLEAPAWEDHLEAAKDLEVRLREALEDWDNRVVPVRHVILIPSSLHPEEPQDSDSDLDIPFL